MSDRENTNLVEPDRPGIQDGGPWAWVLHVYAAFSLAIVAPMYGRLEQRTQFLISLSSLTISILVILWSVVIPAILILVMALLRRWSSRGGWQAILFVLGGCSSLIVLQAFMKFARHIFQEGIGWLAVIAGIACGIAGAVAYRRWQWVRSGLTMVAIGSILLPCSLIWFYARESAQPKITASLQVKNPIPVVMVVFDCFCGVHLLDEKRQIDVDRYPRFAELAATSNWYRNCTSVHPRTDRAVPALLTGMFPDRPCPPSIKEYPQNLFTLLDATQKYSVTALEPFTGLCPANKERDRVPLNPWTEWIAVTRTMGIVFLRDLIPADVPVDLPRIPPEFFGMSQELAVNRGQRRGLIKYSWDIGRSDQFQHYLDCIDQIGGPGFWFGHFALPHFPWNYLPSGKLYARDSGLKPIWGAEGMSNEDWSQDPLAVLHAHQQHLLQLQFTDTLAGRLIDHLRDVGLFDQCLLVVVADHGISFRPGLSGRLPTADSLADIMSVPLFIKLPHQNAGDVVDLNVETIDVLPTVLDVLGLVPPKPLGGQSVIANNFVERPQKIFISEEKRIEVDAALDAKYQLLAEQLAQFGTGADPLRLFKIGPHSELLGRPLKDIPTKGRSPIIIHPMNFDPVAQYPATIVPVHLQATVEWNGQQPPATLAIAINDTIWGTTQSYQPDYLRNYWSVMLPESALQQGQNRIRIFHIVESPQGPELQECTIAAGTVIEPRIP